MKSIKSYSSLNDDEDENIITLDSNEIYLDIDREKIIMMKGALNKVPFNKYPDNENLKLRSLYADYVEGINEKNVLVGNGSDEMIGLVISSLIEPGKKVLMFSKEFSMYEYYTSVQGGEVIKYESERDGKVDVDKFIELGKKEDVDFIIFSNPNNPTGKILTNEEIEKILNEFKDKYILVDEAYYEFYGESVVRYIDKYKNLFVIRGTSKFFSTPGIRLGYGLISNNKIKCEMNSNLDLWNINIFASMMCEVMFNDSEFIESTYSLMTKERDYLINELSKFADLKIYNSQGNFILCEIKSKSLTAKEVREKLIPERIIIRDCVSFDGLDEYFFRVCILKPEENKLLVENLKKIFK